MLLGLLKQTARHRRRGFQSHADTNLAQIFFLFSFFINKSKGLKSACPTDSTTSTKEQQGETARQRLAATKASTMPEWDEMMFFGRGTCLRLCECQDHDITCVLVTIPYGNITSRPSSSLAPEKTLRKNLFEYSPGSSSLPFFLPFGVAETLLLSSHVPLDGGFRFISYAI